MLAATEPPSSESLDRRLAAGESSEYAVLPRPERRRWLVATIIVWVGLNQGMIWMTFSASTAGLQALLPEAGISDSEVDLMLNWGPICYLAAVWVYVFWVSRRGPKALYESVLLCATLICLGAALRGVPFCWPSCPRPRVWLHAGQILNALSGPVSGAVAPSFASIWFPVQERTLATSLVWMCQGAGPALGFAIALAADSPRGLSCILAAEAVSSIGAAVLWGLAVPRLPRSAPSRSAEAQRGMSSSSSSPAAAQSVGRALAELIAVLRRRQFALLALGGGFAIGAFQCWSASLAVLFPESSFPSFDGLRTGLLLSFVGNFGVFVGTLAAGPLGERFFHRRYKRVLLILSGLQALLLGLFSAAVPQPEASHGSVIRLGPWLLLGVLMMASVLNGLTGPLFFELGAEITYPAPEGVSASAFTFTVNSGGMLITALFSILGQAMQGAACCLLMASIVGAGLLLLLPVQEVYLRRSLDEFPEGPKAETTSAAVSTT